MEEAYSLPFCLTAGGKIKNTACWRLEPFEHICAHNVVISGNKVEKNMNHLFANAPAHQPLKEFQKLNFYLEGKSNFMTLIVINIAITAMVDCSKGIPWRSVGGKHTSTPTSWLPEPKWKPWKSMMETTLPKESWLVVIQAEASLGWSMVVE